MATKEFLNYKGKVVLVRHGRWYDLYVDGSLVHADMANREEAIKVYFSYMRVEVQKELNQEK